jgi:hypothetical protein
MCAVPFRLAHEGGGRVCGDAGAKKTLPDFLGECPQFRFLLQLSTNPTTGEAVFRKLQKDVCLKPFYSKRDPPPSGSGYDPL